MPERQRRGGEPTKERVAEEKLQMGTKYSVLGVLRGPFKSGVWYRAWNFLFELPV